MWWIPLILVSSYVAKKIFEDNETPPHQANNVKSTLELNLLRLRSELEKSSTKKIAIIGQPGSGKSTLLHALTKGKCTPLPVIGQKTDATAWHSDLDVNLFNNYKVIQFVDIPGYDTSKHPTDSYLKYFPFSKFDKIIFVINGKIHDSDVKIFNEIIKSGLNEFILVRSNSHDLDDYIGVFNDFDNFFNIKNNDLELVFSSNKTQEGYERLLEFCEIS
jgi:GTPase Era involved in 16S rRNA processing